MFIKKSRLCLRIPTILLIILLLSPSIRASSITNKEENWLSKSCEGKNRILSKHLMLYLEPTISNCLATYYGQPKQSFDRIIYIAPGLPDDEIQIEAQTFTGPHNPPYGKDVLTFLIAPDGTITLIKYQHSDLDILDVDL